MTLNFPNNPTSGATYTGPNNLTYSYDGEKWVTIGSANANIDNQAEFVNVSGDTMTGNLTVPSLNGGQLAGFKNVLINGKVSINQRTVAYAAASVGDYWADRWKKTAGGMTQIVEAGSFKPNTQYTLSGTGITTATGTSPGTGDWDITTTFGDVIPDTATMIQLEEGPIATPFELRPIELQLCQRYYQKSYDQSVAPASNDSGGCRQALSNGVGLFSESVTFPVVMRRG